MVADRVLVFESKSESKNVSVCQKKNMTVKTYTELL